jgi:hypothetical protein
MRAGAVKYGLDVGEGLVESREFCRGLVEGDAGQAQFHKTKCCLTDRHF